MYVFIRVGNHVCQKNPLKNDFIIINNDFNSTLIGELPVCDQMQFQTFYTNLCLKLTGLSHQTYIIYT